jgi:hypothetical protein
MPDYAKIAYEAYAERQDWKNYQGNPIPTWDVVRQDIKDAWGAAVRVVLDVWEHHRASPPQAAP